MSEVQVTPQQIFDSMPQALVPEKAGSTKAMIQFDLSGDSCKVSSRSRATWASPSRWRASSAARANKPLTPPFPSR